MTRVVYILRFLLRRAWLFFYLGRLHFWRSLLASLGLLLTLFIVTMILGVMRPLKEALVSRATGSLPGDVIRLQRPTSSSSAFPLRLFARYPDQSIGLSSREVRAISRWKGVKSIEKTQVLQQPAMGTIDHPMLKNFNWYFDLLIQGTSPSLVRPYLRCHKSFRPTTIIGEDGKKITLIPIVIPAAYAEMFQTYAVINGLPGIDLKSMTGVHLKIYLGQTIMDKKWKSKETVIAEVCGFVPEGIITAIGAPIGWVESQHKKYNQKKAMTSYDQIFVNVPKASDLDEVLRKAKRMGLEVPRKKQRFEQLYKILDRVQYVFWAFAGVLLVLSIIALTNSFALLAVEKKYEFGLYLVFGASPFFIWLLMFFEGAFWGLLHSMVAIAGADHLVSYFWQQLQAVPMMSGLLPAELPQKLALDKSEKTLIVLGATIIAGLASLIPTIFMLGRKTLSLVKKD